MDLVELWIQFKEIFIDLVKYGFPTVAIVISILAYKDSRKVNKTQQKLNIIEEKLKSYELEDKEKEREEESKASVEARIINISKNKYTMKIWNSGEATAYDVDFNVEEKYKNVIYRDKVSYEFLESGKSFEEHVIVYDGIPTKFKVTTTWKSKEGIPSYKEQIVNI